MSGSLGRRPGRRLVTVGGLAAVLCLALTACGGSGSGGASAGAPASPASYPTATDAQVATVAAKAMNPGVDVGRLAPEIKTVFASAANPLTPEQKAIWTRCIAQPICDTGQGSRTIAIIDDQQQPYYSISAGEIYAEAIQSGQVRKIVHSSSHLDVSQFLAAFRQAIAQRVDLIVSIFGAYGAQAGPVLAQAKAAGIPVINGATQLEPDVAKLLAVELRATPCEMWQSAASVLTDHLKAKGVTNPTYAMFSGPAGNAYASSWQPCAEDDLAKLGWRKVYNGYDVWTPQGQAQAASALLASGKTPDVILTDIAPSQFLQAYTDAGQKLPLIMVSGSIDVNALKGYQAAEKAGANPDVWASSSQVWILRAAVVAGLEIADGQKPSSNPITYPLGATPFADIIKNADLDVNSNAIVGSLLAPDEQNEALKH